MKKALFIALTCFSLSTSLQAQDSESQLNTGSVYSYLGLGLPVDYASSLAGSMGLQGVALQDYRLNNLSNPALWSQGIYTNVNGGFSLRAFDATDNLGSRRNSLLQVSQFQLVLPVKRERIGVSLSLAPITESRFQTAQDVVIPADQNNSGSPLEYRVNTSGTGGLNRLELGVGIRIARGLTFGYAPSFIFGVLENTTTYNFEDQNFSNINFTKINSNYGFGNRFGLYFNRYSLFGENDQLAFGATFNLPVNLDSESKVESDIGSANIDLITAGEFGDQDVKMPMEAALGFGYHFNQQWLVSSDVLYQNWSEYQGRNEEMFTDRFKVGFGTQYAAARRSSPGGFFSRFNYRAGASFDTGSLEIDETEIQTYMLTAGIGIPSRGTGSSIDINFDFGFRGTEASDLIAEKIYGIRLSFNLSELMFLQRRID
ncbi:MAG: hypothetical protein WD266_11380 [Balneolales bacterium]